MPTANEEPLEPQSQNEAAAASGFELGVHGGPLSSLYVRNFRVFFSGMFISNVGLWMFFVAQDWLVLTVLTNNSSAAIGILTGMQFLPILLFSPFAGAIVDRFNKRKLLMVTQVIFPAITLVQATLVMTERVELVHVFTLAFLTGVVDTIDGPARQAFVTEMVAEDDITNVIGLNATQFNAARLIGPGLAGVLIGLLGIGEVFMIAIASYIIAFISLVLIDALQLHPAIHGSGSGSVRAGMRYVWTHRRIVMVLFIVFMLSTFGLQFQVTNALMATHVFKVGPEKFGLMGSFQAIGTMAAALVATTRKRPRLEVMVWSLVAFVAFMVLAMFSNNYWAYLGLLIAVGFTSITVLTSANAYVQLSTSPIMRGRVMAFYMMVLLGGSPIGAPLVGWVGEIWGARATIGVGAVASLLAALAAIYAMATHGMSNELWHPIKTRKQK